MNSYETFREEQRTIHRARSLAVRDSSDSEDLAVTGSVTVAVTAKGAGLSAWCASIILTQNVSHACNEASRGPEWRLHRWLWQRSTWCTPQAQLQQQIEQAQHSYWLCVPQAMKPAFI